MNIIFLLLLIVFLFGIPTIGYFCFSKRKKPFIWIKLFGITLILFVAIIAFFIFTLFSYFEKHNSVIISDTSMVINNEPTTFECTPPLSRSFNTADIRILLKDEWSPEPPWKQIELSDNTMVSIQLILKSKNGLEYSPSIFGSSTENNSIFLSARFEPEIPKDAKITAIQLSASSPLTCQKVMWVDWNAE